MQTEEKLAIDGGRPVRTDMLPYGRQAIDRQDIEAVIEVLQSDWLTTGPAVRDFEEALAELVGARYAVTVSSGTAALHTAYHAIELGPGDEIIMPALTFAATANAALYLGAKPVFADILPETLLIDPESVEERITSSTRAVVAVDYAGQPCNYRSLSELARNHNLHLVADACHAIGASYHGVPVGNLAGLNTLSFHPVKHIAMGEGGAVTTNDREFALRMKRFRNHGIDSDHHRRQSAGEWLYDQSVLGFNYRLSDIACALGRSQMSKLGESVLKRREIASRYNREFSRLPGLNPVGFTGNSTHAYHLYILRLDLERLTADRDRVFQALRAEGIGVNVHYRPVYQHSYYREVLGYPQESCPVTEAAFRSIITLPMFPAMSGDDVDDVITAVRKVLAAHTRS